LSLRQSPRIAPLVQALVTQVTGLAPENEDDGDGSDNYRTAMDFVSKNLEYTAKGGASQDMGAMDKQFHGCVPVSINILATQI
jgi:gamma-tubulin complex component 5